MTFAENLRRMRLERFLSQIELARRAGVRSATITRLEGRTTVPSMRTVRALAEALEIEPGDLADPTEVAEVRRSTNRGKTRDDDRLGAWNDDGGAAAVAEDAPSSTRASE
jgi:transcriptional regulator with XRE-family HTH domain